jgi:carboxylesterase
MKLDDFRYMYRGQIIKALEPLEASLLAPVEREGTARNRALLLLHGFSSSPAVYRRMLPLLTMYDTVVCPVLPGHGESIEAFSITTAEDWIDSAMKACEKLTTSYKQVDVMGMSLGGLLACHLSKHFQLNHLYLLAPALSLHLNIPLCLALAKVLQAFGINRIPNRAGNLCSKSHPELAYRQLPLPVIIQILTLIKEFQLVLPSCPVDLFLGRYDRVVNSYKVATRFQKSTRIHWLNHSAHVLPLDEDMEEIVACIKKNQHD